MITENVSTLKIHKLTQEQYDRELEAGNIDETAMYLTPDDASGLTCLYSEIIVGSLPTGTTNVTHSIAKTWGNGIPIVRSVNYVDDTGATVNASPVIYTVMDDNSTGELQIRTQRPTGVAASTTMNYALQVDVIGN